MTEFKSKIEELKPAKELNFVSTPGFGIYKKFFPKEAVAHPAKMNCLLLEYLIEHFTTSGDTVLDCMAGSGSTAILAALHNRQAIAVELEGKFVDWIQQARGKVLGAPTVSPKGEISVIKGDARNLSGLLDGHADSIVTSPPYEGSEAFLDTDFMKQISPDIEARALKYKTGAHKSQPHSASVEAERAYLERTEKGRIENPDSIGKLEKETYLQAMFRVYSEMYKVLKSPGGRAVIVIKPFNREKKVVDLPYQTWLLLEKIGFKLENVLKLRLQHLSFWRVLQYRKFPEQTQIRHEYVLVVRKP